MRSPDYSTWMRNEAQIKFPFVELERNFRTEHHKGDHYG